MWLFNRERKETPKPGAVRAWNEENRHDGRRVLDRLWEELDPSIKERAIAILLRELPDDVWDDLTRRLLVRGTDWYLRYHMNWGMSIRNLLRKRGLTDAMLPPGTAGPEGNWDDYYGAALTAAILERAEKPIREEEEAEERMWEEIGKP